MRRRKHEGRRVVRSKKENGEAKARRAKKGKGKEKREGGRKVRLQERWKWMREIGTYQS